MELSGANKRKSEHMASYYEAMVDMGESSSEFSHQIELVRCQKAQNTKNKAPTKSALDSHALAPPCLMMPANTPRSPALCMGELGHSGCARVCSHRMHNKAV